MNFDDLLEESMTLTERQQAYTVTFDAFSRRLTANAIPNRSGGYTINVTSREGDEGYITVENSMVRYIDENGSIVHSETRARTVTQASIRDHYVPTLLSRKRTDDMFESECGCEELVVEEAEYQGKKVELNKPFSNSDGKSKFAVYVKNDKGNVVKVTFGDPDSTIKRKDPERKKAFRDRHNCSDPGPKWKARY